MIHRRSDTELDKMHQANAIVLQTLELMKNALSPGMTTADLDRIAERELRREGAKSAFKGYRGFPANVCISVNDEVVHGIPSSHRVLREGDLVSLDFGCVVDSYFGDNAITAGVGEIPKHLRRLLEVTESALFNAIDAARAGNRVSDISYAIQSFVEARGFAVVREFVGHGIGRALHEDPPVPNYVRAGRDPKLLPGMCLAIEPMVNSGEHHVKTLADRWTVVTADGSFAAHFERSVAILESGPWILAEPRAVFEGAKVG
ncbi:MAG TPA: type I methionyl aminopeptidase [Vicinamibacteria bacterium]|nr:type I methionyl aminopeptidase [Vicinamibacteria bacterium]